MFVHIAIDRHVAWGQKNRANSLTKLASQIRISIFLSKSCPMTIDFFRKWVLYFKRLQFQIDKKNVKHMGSFV